MSRPTRIVIGPNFFGAGNFGDDLMLAGFLDQVPSGTPVSIVAFTPHDIESQRLRFPQVAWAPDEDAARGRALAEADLWLCLGDTPFQLDSGPWMLDHLSRELEHCSRAKVPMAYLGVGCESEAAAADPRTKALLAASTRVWTRDALSGRCLMGVAPSAAVEIGSDLAHLEFEIGVFPTVESGTLGLLIAYEQEGLVRVPALEQLIEARASAPTRWLIQDGRIFPYAERWNYGALSEAIQRRVIVMPFDYRRDSLETFLENFGAPEIVISTRYHATLVAGWHGSRVAVVARSGKLRGIAQDLDLPWTDSIATPNDLQTLIERARFVSRDRLRRQHERAVAMCDAFFAWLTALGDSRN